MKKTLVIYHSEDIDGWLSSAITKYWLEDYDENNDLSNKEIIYYPYNYGDNIDSLDFNDYDTVIMCDASFPKDKMEIILTLNAKGKLNFCYVDHHISAINDVNSIIKKNKLKVFPSGLMDTKYAACELTWKYFFPFKEMPELIRLAGRYDCFGHKGTSEENKVLCFQYGLREIINNSTTAYEYLLKSLDVEKSESVLLMNILKNGKTIYNYLCTEAKQIYSNSFPIILKGYKFLCVNRERFNPINFGIDYHAQDYDGFCCFWFGKNNKWNFSLYNDNGNLDCSKIAKKYGGGGHKGAAGFIVSDIDKFFDDL